MRCSLFARNPARSQRRGVGAHIRQSRPDSGFKFQTKVSKTFEGVPSSLKTLQAVRGGAFALESATRIATVRFGRDGGGGGRGIEGERGLKREREGARDREGDRGIEQEREKDGEGERVV